LVTSIGDGSFIECSSLTSLTIPDGVTTIGQSAFADCSKLSSVTIGKSIKTIGNNAFGRDLLLSTLHINTVTPPIILPNTFYKGDSTVTVYVPCGSKVNYENNAYWRDFKNIQDSALFRVVAKSADPLMGIAKLNQAPCQNDTAIIEAIANTGYRFVKWNDGNTTNLRTFTVTQDTTFTASFESATGIENIDASSIAIYPNPATDNIYITLPENIHTATFMLYDMQGKELIHQEVSNQETILVNNLATGIYIYNIKTNKENQTGKIRIGN
jgi:hypothetical protein